MKKRFISVLILLVFLIQLSACSSIFKKEYISVSVYEDETHSVFSSSIIRISDYNELLDAIITMVNSHKTDGRLKFTDYKGSLQSDLSQACQEVKIKNAIASYSVNYISYDISRIATYYEAVIYINYKRSKSEIESIPYVEGKSLLEEAFGPVLENLESYTSFKIISPTITEEEVKDAIFRAYLKNPLSSVIMPEANVEIHPKSGMHRIIEVELSYGTTKSELRKMKLALNEKVTEISDTLTSERQAVVALDVYNLLVQKCTYDPTGFMRNDAVNRNFGIGSTAYGVLIEGNADSMGIALAYSALCQAKGIECYVVIGLLNNKNHLWNIVKLEDTYYHVDVSSYSSLGIGDTFMRSDLQMQDKYKWDKDAYPACKGTRSYYEVFSIR